MSAYENNPLVSTNNDLYQDMSNIKQESKTVLRDRSKRPDKQLYVPRALRKTGTGNETVQKVDLKTVTKRTKKGKTSPAVFPSPSKEKIVCDSVEMKEICQDTDKMQSKISMPDKCLINILISEKSNQPSKENNVKNITEVNVDNNYNDNIEPNPAECVAKESEVFEAKDTEINSCLSSSINNSEETILNSFLLENVSSVEEIGISSFEKSPESCEKSIVNFSMDTAASLTNNASDKEPKNLNQTKESSEIAENYSSDLLIEYSELKTKSDDTNISHDKKTENSLCICIAPVQSKVLSENISSEKSNVNNNDDEIEPNATEYVAGQSLVLESTTADVNSCLSTSVNNPQETAISSLLQESTSTSTNKNKDLVEESGVSSFEKNPVSLEESTVNLITDISISLSYNASDKKPEVSSESEVCTERTENYSCDLLFENSEQKTIKSDDTYICHDKKHENSVNIITPIQNKILSESVSSENPTDSWENMFNDEGDCLDPKLKKELTELTGKFVLNIAKRDYSGYRPASRSGPEEYNNIVELYGFPIEFSTQDLTSAFSTFQEASYVIKWVDDCHALAIFSSPVIANQALHLCHPLIKVRPLSEGIKESKEKARFCSRMLEAHKPRPATSAILARRLVSGALGLKVNASKEQRELERKKLKEAREKKKLKAKQKQDIWDGIIS